MNLFATSEQSPMSTMPPIAMPEVEANPAGADVAKRAVCVLIEFSSFGITRKLDAQQLNVNADKSMLGFSKKLLDSPELAAIHKADGEFKRDNLTPPRTLPFPIDAVRLVPNEGVADLLQKFSVYKTITRPALVESFMSVYARQVEEAIQRLGPDLSDRSEYPDAEDVRRRFGVTVRIVSFDAPASLRAIDKRAWEIAEMSARELMQDATEQARDVMRATALELVARLRDALQDSPEGKKRIFRDTAVNKLKVFLQDFNLGNLTNDTALQAEIEKARGLLAGVDAQDLRDSNRFRAKMRQEMEQITANLEPLVMDKPSRKFRPELEQ